MSIADQPLAPSVPFITVEELMTSLPGIPPARIRLSPTPGTATEEDVFRVRRTEGVHCEIFDGVLVEKPMGQYESIIAGRILTAFNVFIDANNLAAVVSGADSMVRLLGWQLRMPDVCVILRSQFPSGQYPQTPVWDAHPDIAVEVLSASNTAVEMERKCGEYFEAGSRLMWVVDPETREVTAYTSPDAPHHYGLDATLDGGAVLPGFQMTVARIFREI